MAYTEEQFNRLPKWAQSEILRLEMQYDELSRRLREFEGKDASNTAIQDGFELVPLPNNSSIEFSVGKGGGNKVTVYINRYGVIDINAYSRMQQQMVIVPSAANAFYVTFVED